MTFCTTRQISPPLRGGVADRPRGCSKEKGRILHFAFAPFRTTWRGANVPLVTLYTDPASQRSCVKRGMTFYTTRQISPPLRGGVADRPRGGSKEKGRILHFASASFTTTWRGANVPLVTLYTDPASPRSRVKRGMTFYLQTHLSIEKYWSEATQFAVILAIAIQIMSGIIS